MTPKKADGVIEAIRYTPEGDIDLIRIYERRGPTYSDLVLIDRAELVKRLKAGKNFFAGTRTPYLASTFELVAPVRLVRKGGEEILVSGDTTAECDSLPHIPRF